MHSRRDRRFIATPVRSRSYGLGGIGGRCSKCGWRWSAGLCACGFIEMDPLRPVTEVLALQALVPHYSLPLGCVSLRLELVVAALGPGEALEIRMSQTDSPGIHTWPPSAALLVDEKEVIKVEPHAEGRRRSDAPLEVTDLVQKLEPLWLDVLATCTLPPSGLGTNRRKLEDASQEFVLCIVKVQADAPVQDLLQSCLTRPVITVEQSLTLLTALRSKEASGLGADECCDCAWSQSLDCPLTQLRMQNPVRGINCHHLRCFELEAFIGLAASTVFHRRWRCPVCDVRLLPSGLAICGLTKKLLMEASPGVKAVALPAGRQPSLLASNLTQKAGPVSCNTRRKRWSSDMLRKEEASDVVSAPHRGDRPVTRPQGWGSRLRTTVTFELPTSLD